MYWLLEKSKQKEVPETLDNLVNRLSIISSEPTHKDQVFPFQGRKAIEHAKEIINTLTSENDIICDPFAGSGSFMYAASMLNRKIAASEYEIYTNRMGLSPYFLPKKEELIKKYEELIEMVTPDINHYYRTKCKCGNIIVIESLFYDREPLRYKNITKHERLGKNNENIVYRKGFKCPYCGATEKMFDDYDRIVMEEINSQNIDFPKDILIENSRINLSGKFVHYENLFPIRSQIVLKILWNAIQRIDCNERIKFFIENAFLSILPLAKFKDYRSKSQDLHCPPIQLRESNILNSFINSFSKRLETLYSYNINDNKINYQCIDYRDLLDSLAKCSVDLIITDPPWNDGNAYFERAQLYHPWLNYSLKKDKDRLSKEVIVSDAPQRTDKNSKDQWWNDINLLFSKSYNVLRDYSYLVLYFRPVPAKDWILNFNKLKFIARKNGFEPLLTIDLSNKDPSMRIQQSSYYAFSSDLILIFIKLKNEEKRIYYNENDIDEISFRVAVELQDELHDSFSYFQWNKKFAEKLKNLGLFELLLPRNKTIIDISFNRVCENISKGLFLPKAITPYSDEIFNTPYIERISLYVPYVIEELLATKDKFTFEQFLLKIAEFVENGTRSILNQILNDSEGSVRSLLELYAEPIEGGKYFTKKPLPKIPRNIENILKLNPNEFEIFAAHLLELEGYKNIAVTGRSGDRGVDIRCNDDENNLIIVQCKRYTKTNISSTPIQRLHSFGITRGAYRKICITTTDFTRDAIDESGKTNVELINRDELDKIIFKHKIF
ncbi:hypothetical protein FACS1894110_17240 [Spirochaetia bacterium]|nr:hypothetical protein FACS1894110_17240 [Spirochaetia bacterium]